MRYAELGLIENFVFYPSKAKAFELTLSPLLQRAKKEMHNHLAKIFKRQFRF
jgi:hypothetical protein